MYVAIEGIKGSGKSTMIDSIYSELRAQYDLDVFSITAPCIEESSNKLLKGIKEQALTDDVCKEYLFFKRACLNQKEIKP
jgi:thymidylate kinase